MSAGDLQVSGGVGGIEARLDDLDAVGELLLRAAGRLAAVAARAAAVTAGPGLASTALASPGTYLAAERALLAAAAGPHGLGAAAARLAALGAAARAAVAAYRAAEAAATEAQRDAEHRLARSAGILTGLIGGPALAVGLPVAALALPRQPEPAPPGGGCRPAAPPGAGAAAGALLERVLGSQATVIEHLVDATPSGLEGLLQASATPAVGPTTVGTGLLGAEGVALVAVLGSPSDVPRTAAAVSGLGRVSPLFHEPGSVRARPVGPARPAAAPAGAAALVAGLQQVSTDSDECAPGVLRSPPQARISVQRLDRPGGGRSWIVSIPGTRTWSPLAGPNPLDLTGNVRAMAQQRTAAGAAVLSAMRQAGVRPGEPVLLAGHSQGGLVAADLAADRLTRREFDITHLVTAGSPIARDQLPAGVQVLALEHDDLVPRLDGAPNPAGPDWVTVTRPASADPQLPAAARASAMPGHSLAGYARTAALVDASSDPSLLAWRRGAAAFLAGPAGRSEVRIYDAERVLR